jgi:hypothetical protein
MILALVLPESRKIVPPRDPPVADRADVDPVPGELAPRTDAGTIDGKPVARRRSRRHHGCSSDAAN